MVELVLVAFGVYALYVIFVIIAVLGAAVLLVSI